MEGRGQGRRGGDGEAGGRRRAAAARPTLLFWRAALGGAHAQAWRHPCSHPPCLPSLPSLPPACHRKAGTPAAEIRVGPRPVTPRFLQRSQLISARIAADIVRVLRQHGMIDEEGYFTGVRAGVGQSRRVGPVQACALLWCLLRRAGTPTEGHFTAKPLLPLLPLQRTRVRRGAPGGSCCSRWCRGSAWSRTSAMWQRCDGGGGGVAGAEVQGPRMRTSRDCLPASRSALSCRMRCPSCW